MKPDRYRNCRACATLFLVSKKNVFMCSEECRKEQARARMRDYQRRFSPGLVTCAICPNQFSAHGMKRYCGTECANKARLQTLKEVTQTEYGKQQAIKGSRKSSRRQRGVVDPDGEVKSGPCEICEKWQDALVLDHCHTTGLFRGWLCHPCNKGIGHLFDDCEILAKAILYLKRKNLILQEGQVRLPSIPSKRHLGKDYNFVVHIPGPGEFSLCGRPKSEIRCYPEIVEFNPVEQKQCCIHCSLKIKPRVHKVVSDPTIPNRQGRWSIISPDGNVVSSGHSSRTKAQILCTSINKETREKEVQDRTKNEMRISRQKELQLQAEVSYDRNRLIDWNRD